jgi:branched-subunit amino acid aminotransferase/4-amino-4-deoxychorismate lyase
LPADQAAVSVFDSSFMQGVGFFSTMRAYGGRVFRLDRHINRLKSSAAALGWTLPVDEDLLRSAVEQVVSATEQSSARVRLTLTSGSLRAGTDEAAGLTVVANASPGVSYPPELYQKGVTINVSRYRQSNLDPTIGHKTTSYFPRLTALREAHANGAFEALWLTLDANIAEGSISNVFIVDDGVLVTPPLDTPVLPGITRAAVLELAAQENIPVREDAFPLETLLKADEAFLTNSMLEIMPVVRVHREVIGNEKPGDFTRQLYEAYGQLVEQECGRG